MILGGLDLGTNAGWSKWAWEYEPNLGYSVVTDPQLLESGVYEMKQAMELRGEVGRWAAYRTLLNEKMGDVEALFYERVPPAAHTGGHAAHIYGGLLATLQLWADDNGIRLQHVSIQAAKRALTGKSNASKEDMVKAAVRLFSVHIIKPDQADAVGVALAGIRGMHRGEYLWQQQTTE